MSPSSILLSPAITAGIPPSTRVFSTSHQSPFPIPLRRAPPRRSFIVCQKLEPNPSPSNDDFITRILKENPSQVEPKYLVGDRFVTLREKQRSGLNFDLGVSKLVKRLLSGEREGKRGESTGPVYLNDILREYKGNLYVPEAVFQENLSEEEEFERNLKELPRMSFEDFQKHLTNGKIKMLTSNSPSVTKASLETGYRDFVVELKEIIREKSLLQTKW